MKIELDRNQLDNILVTITLDILNCIEARKQGKTEREWNYWTNRINDGKALRATVVRQSTVDHDNTQPY